MNTTFQVRFWEIQHKKERRRPYGVRWITAGREHSEWFKLKAQANGRRTELMKAAREGEAFEIESGLPESEVKRRDSPTFLALAQKYLDKKWPSAAATSRMGIVDGLASAGAAFVQDGAGRPSYRELRRVLYSFLLPPPMREQEMSDGDQKIAAWLIENSRTVFELTEQKVARSVLDALTKKLDGKPLSTKLYRRKRSAVFNMLSYAVDEEVLDENPLAKISYKAATNTVETVEEVDPDVVANPRQAGELLTALTYVGQRDRDRGARLVAYFATLYYSAARPAEGMGLRKDDCTLPAEGWGSLALGETRPAAGKRWTDSGEVHDRRGLKHRAPNAKRHVPIPPVLVRILREHIERFGTAEDGRLFRSPRGAVVQSSTYGRIWAEARTYALTPQQVRSSLAETAYDLRHACVSLQLNAGVPATEVARRAGHSVDVLLKVYAKCIYGQRDEMNNKIDKALRGDN